MLSILVVMLTILIKKKTFLSHYNGCKNLAEIFLKKKISSFIQIGSSLEYGASHSPQKENIKCSLKSIKSIYGKAKLYASLYVIGLFKKKISLQLFCVHT